MPPFMPKALLTRGHGTTGDTGAFAGGHFEEDHNKRIVPAIAAALHAAGYEVTTFPSDPTQDVPGTLDTEGRFAHDWMARTPGTKVMIDCHMESSAASGIFAIVPNLCHLVTGAAVRQLPHDQWTNNVGDRALGRAICEEVRALTGLPIRTDWVRMPSLMSEEMTWVGQGGGGAYMPSRLAMFGYTSPFCDSTYRLVVEFGALQNDAVYFTAPSFPANCGNAVVAAMERVFGDVMPPEPPTVEPIPTRVVHALPGAIVRERPALDSGVKASYKQRTALRLTGRATGDEAHGSTEWFQITSRGRSNRGFIHLSSFERRNTL